VLLFANLLVPPVCPACRGRAGEGLAICGACRSALDSEAPVPVRAPAGITGVSAAFRHEGVARQLLTSFKFRSGASLAPFLATLLIERCGPVLESGLIVSVPPSREGLAQRGFDTAGLLATELGRLSPELVVRHRLLRRASGGRQLGRGRRDRLVAAQMSVVTPAIEGPVVLIDDVMTTGATLASSARALRGAGAGEVRAVTLTRRS
jgi:ComF family protein